VKKFDLNSGQMIWDYREREELPVNGPPCVLGDSERVLVLHDGNLLIRLDPATGAKRWSCLLGTEDLSKREGSIALDERQAYCVFRWSSTVTLRAVSLADGSPLWRRHWTGAENSTWSIALAAHHVIAYPDQSGPAEGTERERVPIIENMPVVVHRRETGAL